jgi:hypothetical protein
MGYQSAFVCDCCGIEFPIINAGEDVCFKCDITTPGKLVAESYLCKACTKNLLVLANKEKVHLKGTEFVNLLNEKEGKKIDTIYIREDNEGGPNAK